MKILAKIGDLFQHTLWVILVAIAVYLPFHWLAPNTTERVVHGGFEFIMSLKGQGDRAVSNAIPR
jgi:hypothetical protein